VERCRLWVLSGAAWAWAIGWAGSESRRLGLLLKAWERQLGTLGRRLLGRGVNTAGWGNEIGDWSADVPGVDL
jgi:hypothetical protein